MTTFRDALGQAGSPSWRQWHNVNTMNRALVQLPGQEYIRQDIKDLEKGIESVASLMVSIGYPRLQQLGFELPPPVDTSPEHRLYELLAAEDSDSAHSRYNALIRRLVSFERAAECAR